MVDSVTFDLFARDRASGAFVKVGEAARKAGKDVEGLGRKAGGLSGHFGMVSRVGPRAFSAIATGAKGAGLAMAAATVAGATMGIKTAANLEQAQVAFATLLRSGTKAKTFLSGLADFAKATPFELPGLIDNSRILLGVGVSANKVIPMLRDFGDTAGAVGIQQDGFNRIILAMSQSLSAGKIKLGDMNQLMNNGLPIWKLLSEALGKPVSKIQDLISHGKLLTADVLPKLQAQMHKDYGGAMAKQSQTLAGLWSTFMDTLNIGLAQSIQPLIPAMKEGLAGAIKVMGGALAAIPKVIGPVVTGIKGLFDLLVKGDFTANFRKAFHVEEDSAVVGVLLRIRTGIMNTAAWIKDTGVPAVTAALGTIATFITSTVVPGIKTALAKIDLSGIAGTFTAQAKGWGVALINGVKQGLDTGDWSGLGQTVGKGLVAAIGAAGNLAKMIGGKISELLGKVDWVGIGIALGRQAPSLLIGLAAGIANFDLGGLLKGLAAHWQEILIGVLVLAFAPARLVGKVGELLARIPLAGKLLEWGLVHMHAFSRRLVRLVGEALGFMGRAFLDGFRRVFPGIGARFAVWLSLLPTRIGLAALAVRAAAIRMMAGLARAIAERIASVVARIGELIGRMLRPFAGAAGWLIRRGAEFVGGLVRGVAGMLGSAARAAGRVISTVTGPFRSAGSWLLRVGGDLIGGLFAGIRSAMRGVGSVLSGVKDAIIGGLKRLFGINSPSTVMAGIGGHMITGLIKGLLTNSGALARVVKGIGGTVTGIFPTLLGATQSKASGSMQKMVQGYASLLYGWTGGQWSSLQALINGESGFNPNAQNPTTSAYGLFQFLDSTWAGVNATKTSNPQAQTLAGLRYIKQVYGSPANAYGSWLSRSPHWYGAGMAPTVFSRPTVIGVGERGPETVSVVPHGGRGTGVVVNVHLNGPVMGNARQIARELGPEIQQVLRERLQSQGRPGIL